jgi:hypothetical protein
MYGQRYATPRVQKKPPPRYVSSTPPKKSKTCCKCGEELHFVAGCPRKDLSLTDVARGRLKTSDDDRSATRILFELVSGLDADSSQDEEDHHIEIATYFDELVEEKQRDQHFLLVQLVDRRNMTGLNKIQGGFNDIEKHRPARARFKDPCVYDVEWKTPNPPSKPIQGRPFNGDVLETGPQMTVIRMEQAKGYCKESGNMFSLLPSRSRFKFGASAERSLGNISIEIPTPGSPIHINCDVLKSDLPLLIGLDILDKYGLNVLSVEGLLQSTTEHWTIPIQRLWGHIYLQWDPGIQLFFTRAELTKIHRHFLDPSTVKLVNLLKRATPGNVPKETRAQLDGIQKACKTCTNCSPRPQHVQVTIDPDRIVFNNEIITDLMYLESKPVLHVVDRGTTFSSANFLYSSDRITVWNTFVQCWTSMYFGFPDSILTEQGSVFQSDDWNNACLGA